MLVSGRAGRASACPVCVGAPGVPSGLLWGLGAGKSAGCGAETGSQAPAAEWVALFCSWALAVCSSFFSMIRNDYCHQNIGEKTNNPRHAVITLALVGEPRGLSSSSSQLSHGFAVTWAGPLPSLSLSFATCKIGD